MLTFNTNNPQSCGVVETDEQGIVQAFHEKVKNPPNNTANGAVYAFDEELIELINNLSGEISDFSNQVLPKLLGKIATFHIKEKFIDIGTPTALREAQSIYEK